MSVLPPGEYSLLKLSGQEMCELFPTGKNQEPRVTLLQDGRSGTNSITAVTAGNNSCHSWK